jgi:hypothetical protein
VAKDTCGLNVICTKSLKALNGISGNGCVCGAAQTRGANTIEASNFIYIGRQEIDCDSIIAKQQRGAMSLEKKMAGVGTRRGKIEAEEIGARLQVQIINISVCLLSKKKKNKKKNKKKSLFLSFAYLLRWLSCARCLP